MKINHQTRLGYAIYHSEHGEPSILGITSILDDFAPPDLSSVPMQEIVYYVPERKVRVCVRVCPVTDLQLMLVFLLTVTTTFT